MIGRNGHACIMLLPNVGFTHLNAEFKDGQLMKFVYLKKLMLLSQTLMSEFKHTVKFLYFRCMQYLQTWFLNFLYVFLGQ
jgi:hypothetical protein